MSNFESRADIHKNGLVNLHALLKGATEKGKPKAKFSISPDKVYMLELPGKFQAYKCGVQYEDPYAFEGKEILDGMVTIHLNEDLKQPNMIKVLEFSDWAARDDYEVSGKSPSNIVSVDLHMLPVNVASDSKNNTSPYVSQNLSVEGGQFGSDIKDKQVIQSKDGSLTTSMKMMITIPYATGAPIPFGQIVNFFDKDQGDGVRSVNVMVLNEKQTKTSILGYRNTFVSAPSQIKFDTFKVSIKLPSVFGEKEIPIYESVSDGISVDDGISVSDPLPAKNYVFSNAQWKDVVLDYGSNNLSEKRNVSISPILIKAYDYRGGKTEIDVTFQFQK